MPEHSDVRQKWAIYLNRWKGDRSQADYARLLGVTEGQLSKWRTGATGVKVETVIAIARKLGDSPLHVLVEVGYLEPEDVAQFKVARPYALDTFTDTELSAEILRRVQAGAATGALTDPVQLAQDETGHIAPVHHLPRPHLVDLGEVASESITHDPDDTDDKYDA
ncbi:helix-turn-helix transcriptional regulator [Microbacterium sp. QXD-8]|uniref:Helix-turn-helix transcriptional regulator n=1 Tax=Microbacterium psychrotolerans TaxID=3068321 RepID=A0ABU0YYA7_9MICO|nr:helix-turn-helix transcriptional regulator [Microbacterium sp. QXD-8]MDQ7877317.1 helix-turn-helix transcriptional regulator [Microbacterium sp. QXD-8]